MPTQQELLEQQRQRQAQRRVSSAFSTPSAQNRLREEGRQKMKQAAGACEELKKMLEDDMPMIEEGQFVSEFLPTLVQRVDCDLRPWLAVCRHPNNRVRVVNAKGEVLYTVPPILGQYRSMLRKYPSPATLGEVVQESEKRGQQHPLRGRAYFSKALDKIMDENKKPDESLLREWDAIITRYGYPSIFHKAVEKKDAANKRADYDINFDYEPEDD